MRDVLAMWRSVLDTSPEDGGDAGVRFFDAGGNSITAFRIATTLSSAGWSIEVADLFDDPTPGELATLISARHGETP